MPTDSKPAFFKNPNINLKNMKNFTSIYQFTFVLTLFLGTNSFAVTKTVSQSGNWSATTTWGGNPAPVAGDDVIINGGFTVTVDILTAACLSVQIGGSTLGTGTGALSFASGSKLTVSGAINIGPFNNNNTAGSLIMTSGGTLACEGFVVGRIGTWTEGTGTIELTVTNTIPASTLVNFNNLIVSGGTTTFSRNISILGNLTINSGATLDGGANSTTLSGDMINNGTFTGNTGTVIFAKNGNQTIMGSGINNFNLLKVSMGTNVNNTLEVLAANFSAPDAFLTLTNGTFKMSGTFTFANTFLTGPIYNIQTGTGLWINNPNATVTGQAAGGASIRGLLRLSAGTINIGTGADNSLDYVSGSTIVIEGGALNIAGRLTQNNATATTSYTQSGGTVTVVAQGSTDPTFAGFDLGAVGSSFTMSGGTIVIRNATSAPSDFLNAAAISNVTGGTLQIGDANTANTQIIRIQSAHPMGSLLVSNATTQAIKPTAQIITSSLNLAGSVTIQSGTTLNANGLNVSLGGDWTNNGTFMGGNTVIFNGTVGQAITTPGGGTFSNLTVNKASGTLSLNNSDVNISGSLTLTNGAFSIGANTLTLNGAFSTGSGSLVGGNSSNLVVGGAGTGFTLSAVTLNSLTVNRASGLSLGGDVTINGTLLITNGTLNTGISNIILGPTGTLSEVTGHPVIGNVRTTRNITAISGTELFGNIGVEITLNGVAPGSITVTRNTGTASTGNAHNSIKRYFDITPTLNVGLKADFVFHYDTSELNGQNANALELYRSRSNGTTWNNMGGIANKVSGTISLKGINDFSRWTAADTSNRLGNAPAPSTIGISPTAKSIGDPSFTMTVNGTDFVNGKSTIRFNGVTKATTYINSGQLTASITANDLLILGSFPVAVFNTDGGGLSNTQTFMVNQVPAKVNVETAADGSGAIVPTQSLAFGASITAYAITRDASNNFLANVAADAWSLGNVTGSIAAGDLTPSADHKSAIFKGNLSGSANIMVTSGTLTAFPSGVVTVTAATGIAEAEQTPAFALLQNYPNPFRSSTTISYEIPARTSVILKVFDMNGREVVTLVNQVEDAGHKSVIFVASGLPNGIYTYRLQAGNYIETRKLLLSR